MKTVRFQSSYIEPYPLQIVGEESYRDEIENISGYMGEDEDVNADDFIAQLILEDNNPYDRGNAVAVKIDGKTVGYLSKGNAKKYRIRLAELGLSDVVGECYASIRGGFIRKSTGEQADFGVRLDLDLATFKINEPPLRVAQPAPAPLKQQSIPAQQSTKPEANKNRAFAAFIIISFVVLFFICLVIRYI